MQLNEPIFLYDMYLFQGYTRTNEFILTQHPIESTVEDFWRMVWDQNSSVIVLLSDVLDEVSISISS